MPSPRLTCLLPVAALCSVLAAQEPPQAPEKKEPARATEVSPDEERNIEEGRHPGCRRHRHAVFGASVQADFPLRDLKQNLNGRTGLGLGVQWTYDHGDWNAERTRLEWNTFPESGPVGLSGNRTYAKNYLLSFDHLFKLSRGDHRAYAVWGLGAARWNVEETSGSAHDSRWTTKLGVTAGLGLRLSPRVNLEARYLVSSVAKTFDADTLQISLGWRH